MTTQVVDSNGEVRLPKALLEQRGARPGDTVEIRIRVVGDRSTTRGKPRMTWRDFAGSMIPPTGVKLTTEQINEAIEEAGAEAGMAGLKDR